MSLLIRQRWFRHLGIATVAALSLCAATALTAPAQAQVSVGIGFPGYYAPPAYYPYGYGYGYSYGYPAYYGGYSPYYGYPSGGVYFSFGGGHHRHHR